jgi:hypothetical protein
MMELRNSPPSKTMRRAGHDTSLAARKEPSMPVIPPTPWSQLEPGMATGDLILFSGSKTGSDWIELISGGMFSHSTMIYRPDPQQPPLMWQEAPNGIVDDPWINTGDPAKVLHGGAQLGDALAASQVIRYQYNDDAYYVKLNWDRPSDLDQRMDSVITTYEGRPFGTQLEMALYYLIGHEFNISSGEATLYCAALIAVTYMAIGLLSDKHPANWYSPNSFVNPQDANMPWAATATFDAPIYLDVPPPTAASTVADLTEWPAGPLAPATLPSAPRAPWMSTAR